MVARGRRTSDGPDRRRARRGRGQQRARRGRCRRPAGAGPRWKERLGPVGVGKVNLGKLGYPIGAVLSAFQPPSVHMHVEVDGKVVTDLDQPVLMVAIGNGANVGGGTELTPEADPEDGQVDVMISHAVGARRQARLRLPPAARGAPPARRRAVPPRVPGDDLRRRVLDQRRRRDQRPGAAAELARRAGGVLLHPAKRAVDREERAVCVGSRRSSKRTTSSRGRDRASNPVTGLTAVTVVSTGSTDGPATATRVARPRHRPGSGCRRRARSSARRSDGGRCAG